MATVTNKLDLPGPLVTAAQMDDYHRGDADISVTSLVDSPRIFLMREHYSDVAMLDTSDAMFSMLGKAFHMVMEQGTEDDMVKEERYKIEASGLTISGQIDRLDVAEQKITDYKMTTIAALKHGPRASWIAQLNCYAFMVFQHYGFWPTLEVIALIRDFRDYEKRHRKTYPDSMIQRIRISQWNPEVVERYVRTRAALHAEAIERYQTEGILPECSDEDRWAKPDRWHIKMQSGSYLNEGFPTRQEAESYLQLLRNRSIARTGKIVFEAGHDRRCENYCAFSKSCSQYQQILDTRAASSMMERMASP